MPKENKQRGRREKRKREEPEVVHEPIKKTKSSEDARDEFREGGVDVISLDPTAIAPNRHPEDPQDEAEDRPYYGMLDEDEQEYFKQADEALENNDFPSDEERAMFLSGVFDYATGKELKLANSQSCSRLMERLIILSSTAQKKKLFEAFSGNFPHLIQHRFASHCCETLFIQSAPIVTEELTSDGGAAVEFSENTQTDAVFVSMENLFLYTLNELEGNMTFLLTDRFASHTLRVLLIVLSGLPLAKESTKSLLQSKRKEKINIGNHESGVAETALSARAVPESFTFAISKIISDTVASLDTAFIRVLATHPSGNPCLQLLLELELTQMSKSKGAAVQPGSIIAKLLPDDIETEGSESATFINGIIYEQIGSRLLETIMTHAPGKLFKQIYRSVFKERMGNLARNEIASYVVIKVLERLSKEDLEEAVTLIIPQLSSLVERNRTTVIKTLLERCYKRHAFDSIASLTKSIAEAYGNDPTTLITKMTQFTPPPAPNSRAAQIPETQTSRPEALHGSLLAQTMLSLPNTPSQLIQTSLLALDSTTLLQFGLQTTTSHVLQSALLPTTTNTAFRRKIIHSLISSSSTITDPSTQTTTSQPGILTLALSKPGSYTLDALYTGTAGLMMLKERIATILVEAEAVLREDICGRVVWRNWMLDLFLRRRADWINRVKAGEGGSTSTNSKNASTPKPTTSSTNDTTTTTTAEAKMNAPKASAAVKTQKTEGKTALQLAREKFAAGKAAGGGRQVGGHLKGKKFRPTGANAGVVSEGRS